MANTIRFFPTDVSYRIIEEKPAILLFGKTEDGKSLCVLDFDFRPYFLAVPEPGKDIEEELEKLKIEEKDFTASVTGVEKTEKKLFGTKTECLKVYANFPKAVPKIADKIKHWDSVKSIYENDIKFVRRYLIDKKIFPFSLVEVQGEPYQMKAKVPVFKASEISQSTEENLDSLSILGFDIETYNPDGRAIDPENNPIIMISLYGKNMERVITWKRFKTKNEYVHFVDSEADLIEEFKDLLEKERPDILAGYYSDAFDLPYITARAKKYKIKLDLGLDYSLLDIKRKTNKSGTITGINHIDVHAFIKNIFGRSMVSLSLDSVSEKLLGEKKIEVDMDSLADTWDNEPENLDIFCEYNLQDSVLVYRLMEKLVPNMSELVKMIGINLYDVARMGMSQLIEWYLIRMTSEFNEIVPNKPGYNDIRTRLKNTFKGGYVFEPEPGLYKDLVIFDYRSLYPSIISAHNISPETIKCDCCRDDSEQKVVKGRWFCSKKKGFIPTIVNDLITRRIRIKKIIDAGKGSTFLQAKQENFKLLANSFYGYLGFYAARWYSIESAEAVTSYGRNYINMVIKRSEKEGFRVVYGDTDSIFLTLEGKSIDEAKKLVDSINLELPDLMELEYEGFYPSGIFVKAKAAEAGAKKRYALLDSNDNIMIKGFETVRRNWSQIGKDVQKKVLNILLKEHNPEKAVEYIKTVIRQLREQSTDIEKVVISTQIQKKIKDYSTQGPHVKAAMRMERKGANVNPGMNIRFVVTKGEGNIGDRVRLPEEVTKEDYDPDYYINNQVIPSVERLLNIFGFEKEDLAESREQSKLDSFLKKG